MALAMASSSSSSASVAVEKATSDLLIGPDWTMNIDICDSINSNHWLAKDVVKAVKKRLQHKNPKVQLLALTLLETMVKNCGDFVHFQIAEKNILGEMVRIVKKKADMHVRDKILVLLDSWQEAFGGPGGKHPQYYWAYEELRRSGVGFPQRSLDASPIFTPPVAHSTLRHAQAGYGMPVNSSRRLDETMATEFEGLSLSGLESMRNVMELLSDMLQAVNPDDCAAVKDEVIVDLVNRCRSNQKKLMQMLTTTGDEELLGQGLELNDSLQILLAKHDAIASGSPMPIQTTNLAPKPTEGQLSNVKATEVKDHSPSSSINATVPVATATRSNIEEEDEEEDDFAQLARRHSKAQSSPPPSANDTSKALVSVETSTVTSSSQTASSPAPCNALALPDSPAPVKTTKEQDIIDLLSISLSTSHVTSSPHTPIASNQSTPQAPSSSTQGNPYSSQTFSGNQGQAGFNSYVVPWAQPQQQPQLQYPSQPQLQHPSQPPSQSQPQFQQQFHPQSKLQQHSPTQSQQQFQPQSQAQPHFQPQHQLQSQQAHIQPQPQQQFQTQSQPQHPQPVHQPQQQFQPHSLSQLHAQPQVRTHQQFQPQSQPQQQFQPQSQPQQQFQPQSQPQQQFQPQSQPQQQFQPQSQPQQQFLPQVARQFQQQSHSQNPQYSSGYPPPPWAATPGYANGQSNMPTTSNMITTPQANAAASYTPAQASRPLQNVNSIPRVSNGLAMNGDPLVSSGPRNSTTTGQKPFIPSYRLFEDLNVLSNSDGRYKVTGSSSPSLSGPSTQGMVGGRK